jgi:hypothetical protein
MAGHLPVDPIATDDIRTVRLRSAARGGTYTAVR